MDSNIVKSESTDSKLKIDKKEKLEFYLSDSKSEKSEKKSESGGSDVDKIEKNEKNDRKVKNEKDEKQLINDNADNEYNNRVINEKSFDSDLNMLNKIIEKEEIVERSESKNTGESDEDNDDNNDDDSDVEEGGDMESDGGEQSIEYSKLNSNSGNDHSNLKIGIADNLNFDSNDNDDHYFSQNDDSSIW
eukprot:CAMPEP_0119055700 /NCGR_PEP_ID=MMETSP1177-20130426/75885_1 /TAXON_ID=2985 /ORGANISM="Ochromonas sp, Strain CCMP1899" /LENGTH=189 /DNA_ID=CAMNT_0007036309 /DNA_START=777 /DNA_END=1343 /DNA_ORIENTATION=-